MVYLIELAESKTFPALSIRKTVSAERLPLEIRAASDAITSYVHDIGGQEAGLLYAAYHNRDMENLDVEIGYVTDHEYPGMGDINAETIPAGRKVSFIHKGPYKEMGHGYSAAYAWMKENDYLPSGVVYEFYFTLPDAVPERELVTKVEFLLEKAV